MKYIYIVSDILDINQNPTARYFVAERIPCDVGGGAKTCGGVEQ